MVLIRKPKEEARTLERKWGWRQQCLGSSLTLQGLCLSPRWPWEGYILPAGLWPLGIPWDSSNCMRFTFGPAHYLQRLVKYTDFPGGLGAIPTNRRALRWKPELSLRGVFLCSLPGPPIHINGGSWRPVSLPLDPAGETLENKQGFIQLVSQLARLHLYCVLSECPISLVWVAMVEAGRGAVHLAGTAWPGWGDTGMKQLWRKTRRWRLNSSLAQILRLWELW